MPPTAAFVLGPPGCQAGGNDVARSSIGGIASADSDKAKETATGGSKAGKYDNDRGRGDNDDRGNSGGPAFDHRAAVP
jgi:hypothetical protein